MKIFSLIFYILILAYAQGQIIKTITLARQQLEDKIKGGWAGQTIGVTFGGPYEKILNPSNEQVFNIAVAIIYSDQMYHAFDANPSH